MWFLLITQIFIIPILSIIGFIFNLLSTIVFSLIIKNGQRDNMYKHLLFKSICEMMGCLFSTLYPMYYYFGDTYMMVVWTIWFASYIIPALFMASSGFEIAATFSCAISIEKQMKWCEHRLSFWIWVLFILISSFGVEMFPVLVYSISTYNYTDQFNITVHGYYPSINSKIDKFCLVESAIREVLFFIILLSLNCYILFKLIRIGRRKKRLNGKNSLYIQNGNRAEVRKIVMIIVLFLTFILGHLPNFLWNVIRDFDSILFWADFTSYGVMFLYISYSTSFFVYFAFNNIFSSFLKEIIHFRSF
jgi:hypothetical protein